MNVWGEIWENAVYLVCNYSPKGNWIGEAPYKNGRPCSECPPSYGGSCTNNLCYKGDKHAGTVETDETNEIESPRVPEETLIWVHEKINKPKVVPKTPKPKTPQPKTPQPTNENLMTQVMKCETRMRDKCKGSTSVTGISVRTAAQVRKGRSLGPFSMIAFSCPSRCKDEPSHWAPVIGSNIYADTSSICRTAVHAGVIKDESGGYVDVMPMDRKNHYIGSNKNGIHSESIRNRKEGVKAFRVFPVKQ
ncbi:unnamed protein product [Ranitomeya imitator]|uniref:LCCL domain-containing protein n=1 Tax=Ranitomeya imitator TaxID=111125 RepID=A0ABN9M6M9_9NEOB|nr:unnamed protein product [Ranitomeya imitator]